MTKSGKLVSIIKSNIRELSDLFFLRVVFIDPLTFLLLQFDTYIFAIFLLLVMKH